MSQPLYKSSLREAARCIREGGLTAVEATRACLTRHSRLEPRVQAWEHLEAARAMERAEELDAALGAGTAAGALHGIALGVKDIIHVAGMPTGMGSAVFAGGIARETAPVVARLEAAGAIILGKTVTAELAYYTPGKTRNPWNPAHTPGGSSMGSAAAVAAGMCFGALGTQTNGSVIRPAAFCGVVGFKPSHGALPTAGMLAFAPSLDTVGVLARTVADAALIAAVCAAAAPPAAAVPSRPPRLAAVRSPVWEAAQPEQREIFASNVAALARAGALVEPVELPAPFAQAHAAQRAIMGYEGARSLAAVQREHRERLSARLNAFLDEGARVGEARYREALATRARLAETFARFMNRFDAVVTPPAKGEAPATLEETGDPVFCTLWTLLGAPALSIPVGLGPQGLPLGLQIVGAPGRDAAALAAAAWCEAQLPFAGLP